MKAPLPMDWVDKIFKKLTLVYGRDFQSRWEGLDTMEVKVDWAHELAGFQDNAKAISHALQNLPHGKPPTVLEFRALALKCPAEAVVFLPHPKADADKIAQALLATAEIKKAPVYDMKEWARRLIRMHEAGDKVRPYSLNLAREALKPRAQA